MTDRSPQEIEREIELSRRNMGRTLDAVQERLSPAEIMDHGRRDDISHGASQFMTNLGRSIRDNPLPVALIGTGLCSLMFSGERRRREVWEGR